MASKITLEAFLAELTSINNDEELLDFSRRWVLHGTPAVFSGDENAYYKFTT